MIHDSQFKTGLNSKIFITYIHVRTCVETAQTELCVSIYTYVQQTPKCS